MTSAHTPTPGARLERVCPSHLGLGQLRAAGTVRESASFVSFVVVSVLKRLYSRLLVLDLPSSSVMSCCLHLTDQTNRWVELRQLVAKNQNKRSPWPTSAHPPPSTLTKG